MKTGCAVCGSPEDHDEVINGRTFTHIYDNGIEIRAVDDKSFVSSLISEALAEKEREIVSLLQSRLVTGIKFNKNSIKVKNLVNSALLDAIALITNKQ
jgi:hypothetical protein